VNDESMTLAQVRARLEEADLMEREIAALKDRVRSLQSQLAWTPVSAGLPTEPGVYEFAEVSRLDLILPGGAFRFEGRKEFAVPHMGRWQYYRRIELPNGD